MVRGQMCGSFAPSPTHALALLSSFDFLRGSCSCSCAPLAPALSRLAHIDKRKDQCLHTTPMYPFHKFIIVPMHIVWPSVSAEYQK